MIRLLTSFTANYLPKSFKRAVKARDHHVMLHMKFTDTFNAALTNEWLGMVTAWEADHRRENPYADPEWSKCDLMRVALDFSILISHQVRR